MHGEVLDDVQHVLVDEVVRHAPTVDRPAPEASKTCCLPFNDVLLLVVLLLLVHEVVPFLLLVPLFPLPTSLSFLELHLYLHQTHQTLDFHLSGFRSRGCPAIRITCSIDANLW